MTQLDSRTRAYANGRPKRWAVAAEAGDRARDLGRELGISSVTAQILINRGIDAADVGRAFLSPSLKDLHEPSLLPGLPAAAERVAQAIRSRQRIVVYGDYDVDGITASAILWHALRALGADVRTYVPHRVEEGYGLNVEAIRQLCDDGAQLVITVDCGITAINPIRTARERGVDVVVTDHHEWKTIADCRLLPESANVEGDAAASIEHRTSNIGHASLPATDFIVHPRLGDYPNPHLCGAGVAFKLAWGVGQLLGSGGRVPEAMKRLLVEMTALAALGTIADVVPLIGENRVLARHGLGGLKQSQLHGIRALIAACELDGQKLDSYHVGFLLGPRLNAAGRMGHARLAVEMLTDASPARATEIAIYLEQQNKLRQATEREILKSAIEQAEALGLTDDAHHGIVLGRVGWHPGVIGIVASRMVERFHKPTIIIALADDHGHGSGRSIAGFHLANALDACRVHLKTCGGHEMAAGLGIEPSNLDAFRGAFLDYAKSNLTPEQLVPTVRIDAIAEFASVTEALVHEFSRLGPFGNGNPKPMIACRGVTLTAAPRKVGKTAAHLQLFMRQGSRIFKGIAFNAADQAEHLSAGTSIDLAVQPQLNEWNGSSNVELEVKDIVLHAD